jgi:hypothetical protein
MSWLEGSFSSRDISLTSMTPRDKDLAHGFQNTKFYHTYREIIRILTRRPRK